MYQKPTYEELKKRVRELEKVEVECKKSEEALQKKMQRFLDLAESTSDWIWETDLKGMYTYSNHKVTEFLGYEPEELIGKTPFDLMPIDESKRVSDLFNTFLSSQSSFESMENVNIHKNGSRVVMETSGVPIFDNEGELLGYRGIDRDITHRKYVEETLKKSKEELKSIFRAAPTGIGLVSDRIIQQANDRICEMTGYSKNELIGQNARIFYPTDEDFEYVGKEKYRQIKTLGTGTVETHFKRKDGEIIDVLMSSTPLDPTNLSAGVTFTALDITKRKMAEEALRESQNRLRDISLSMADWIWETDGETKFTYLSQSIKDVLGYAPEELIGKTPFDLMPEDESVRVKEIVSKIISKSENIKDLENWNIDKEGHRLFMLTSGIPILNNEGKIQGYRGVNKNITTQRKLETQLQQAQKMESIGTLAGGIAHDFNNILFPIVGYTEMLLEDVPKNSPFRDSLNKIYNSSLRAKDLVNQILTFSRQEASELKLIKMQPVIKEALKLMRSTIPTTIEIKQDINADCGVIKVDPTQIHQIVMNLTTNAYHAMEETGGELKVSLKQINLETLDLMDPKMEPGAYACLIVADTGVGMDKNVTDKIFDPFFTTKAIGKGTGMGLSVVHGIVTIMGGAIQVYSEQGKGTEFHVYFPVEKNSLKKQTTHSKIQIQGGTEQILIVDDEEEILAMEKKMLERLGYQVTSLTDSMEALEIFRASPHRFDLIITDMAMPNMAGDKLSAELTKIRSDIPVLLCTGFSKTMSEEQAISQGIKGFLFKPIVMKELAQKIREVLGGMVF